MKVSSVSSPFKRPPPKKHSPTAPNHRKRLEKMWLDDRARNQDPGTMANPHVKATEPAIAVKHPAATAIQRTLMETIASIGCFGLAESLTIPHAGIAPCCETFCILIRSSPG